MSLLTCHHLHQQQQQEKKSEANSRIKYLQLLKKRFTKAGHSTLGAKAAWLPKTATDKGALKCVCVSENFIFDSHKLPQT